MAHKRLRQKDENINSFLAGLQQGSQEKKRHIGEDSCSSRMQENQSGMESLQRNIHALREWQISTETLIKQKDQQIADNNQTTESMRVMIVELQLHNEELNTQLKTDSQKREELTSRINTSREMCNLLKSYLHELEGKIEECQESKRTYVERQAEMLKTIASLDKKYDDLVYQFSNTKQELELSLTTEIENNEIIQKKYEDSIQDTDKQISGLQDIVSEKESLINNLEKQIQELTTEVQNLREEIDKIMLEKENADKQIEDMELQFNKLNVDNLAVQKDYECKVQNLTTELEELGKIREERKTEKLKYELDLSSANAKNEELVKSVETIAKSLEILENTDKEKTTALEKIEKELELDKEKYTEEKASLTAENEKLVKSVETIAKSLEILENTDKEKTAALEKIEKELELEKEKYTGEKASLTAEISDLNTQLAKRTAEMKELEEKQKELELDKEKYTGEKASLTAEISDLNTQLAKRTAEMKELEEKQKAYSEAMSSSMDEYRAEWQQIVNSKNGEIRQLVDSHTRKVKEKDEEIRLITEQLETKCSAFEEEIQLTKEQSKKEVQKFQKEIQQLKEQLHKSKRSEEAAIPKAPLKEQNIIRGSSIPDIMDKNAVRKSWFKSNAHYTDTDSDVIDISEKFIRQKEMKRNAQPAQHKSKMDTKKTVSDSTSAIKEVEKNPPSTSVAQPKYRIFKTREEDRPKLVFQKKMPSNFKLVPKRPVAKETRTSSSTQEDEDGSIGWSGI